MDEMKIKLSNKLICNTIAKLITSVVKKKTGIKMELCINSIKAETIDGKLQFHVDAGGEIDEKALLKINRIIET